MVTAFEQYTRVVRSYSCNVNFQSYYLQKLAIFTLTRLNFIRDCTRSVDRRFRQHLFWNWSSITHGVVIWQHRLFVSLWRILLSVVWKLYTKVEIGTYSLSLFCLQIDANGHEKDRRGIVNKTCKCGFWLSTSFGAASHSWRALCV